MPFVKLDCGILNSTIWFERECREVFLTALLMAEPVELTSPTEQIEVNSLNATGWVVPPGWYGFVPAAGVGIINRAGVDQAAGLVALERLGSPEQSSRSPEFEGRRLVRVDGGYLVLNYMKYRERDYTSAERQRRYRERLALRRNSAPSRRNITQAEAEAEAEVEVEVQTEKRKSAPRGHAQHAFCGQHFCISHRQHEFFGRELGAAANGFDLLGAYQRWDLRTDPIDNLLPWVKARIAEELPAVKKTSSPQATQHVGQGPSPRDLELIAEWEREHKV